MASNVKITSQLDSKNENSGSKLNPAVKRRADSDDAPKTKGISEQKKIAFGLIKKPKESEGSPNKKKPVPSISIKLGTPAASNTSVPALKPKVGTAAIAFNEEDDDEEEEMPPEAKMRMKNIGRDTPTSSGPNSFGKSRMGFCDSKKMYERKLKEIQDMLED